MSGVARTTLDDGRKALEVGDWARARTAFETVLARRTRPRRCWDWEIRSLARGDRRRDRCLAASRCRVPAGSAGRSGAGQLWRRSTSPSRTTRASARRCGAWVAGSRREARRGLRARAGAGWFLVITASLEPHDPGSGAPSGSATGEQLVEGPGRPGLIAGSTWGAGIQRVPDRGVPGSPLAPCGIFVPAGRLDERRELYLKGVSLDTAVRELGLIAVVRPRSTGGRQPVDAGLRTDTKRRPRRRRTRDATVPGWSPRTPPFWSADSAPCA